MIYIFVIILSNIILVCLSSMCILEQIKTLQENLVIELQKNTKVLEEIKENTDTSNVLLRSINFDVNCIRYKIPNTNEELLDKLYERTKIALIKQVKEEVDNVTK